MDYPIEFTRFPKVRPVLPTSYEKIYKDHYQRNRSGDTKASSLSQKLESWMHRQVASFSSNDQDVLELGAGNLNHLIYESYSSYDVIEPFKDLLMSAGSDRLSCVRNFYSDTAQVTESYHRILSVAVLEHICNLPEVVAQLALHLKPGGVFVHGIPSEGTFLWKLGYEATTGLEFRLRYGLKYSVLMNYEHVNSANEIMNVIKYFFDDVKIKVFGISTGISLYQTVVARKPNNDLAKAYLDSI
jgi:SAM-dependent methyltransferase